MALIFEMQGRQGTAHLFFIPMYKQWQNNLQNREMDLIRHIRVQTHTLAGQTRECASILQMPHNTGREPTQEKKLN